MAARIFHTSTPLSELLAAEETLQQIYDTISDKPEKIVKYENAPVLTTSSGTVYF